MLLQRQNKIFEKAGSKLPKDSINQDSAIDKTIVNDINYPITFQHLTLKAMIRTHTPFVRTMIDNHRKILIDLMWNQRIEDLIKYS